MNEVKLLKQTKSTGSESHEAITRTHTSEDLYAVVECYTRDRTETIYFRHELTFPKKSSIEEQLPNRRTLAETKVTVSRFIVALKKSRCSFL